MERCNYTVFLEDLVGQLKEVILMFQTIYFTHVYHGHNCLADALSKEMQQVGAGRISK